MLTMGGTLLKAGLKAVAEMVVGDKGTFRVVDVDGDADDRLWPNWVVDEVEEVDEEVDNR